MAIKILNKIFCLCLLSCSLAATNDSSVDLNFGYLDDSVYQIFCLNILNTLFI